MDLEIVKKEIKAWSNLVNGFKRSKEGSVEYLEKGSTILRSLNQGDYFTITEAEIKKWSTVLSTATNAASIHIYAALDIYSQYFKFYIIDSENDKNRNFQGTIIEKKFSYNLLNGKESRGLLNKFNNSFSPRKDSSSTSSDRDELALETVIVRRFKWSLLSKDWLINQKDAGVSVFKVMETPFQDYEALNLGPGDYCFNFFGLKASNLVEENDKIEIIVTKEFTLNTILGSGQDFSSPRPPFSLVDPKSNYQLLIASENV
ncbi:hypothetical protein [Pontimicrobium sp. MEBiC06410]